MFTGLIEDIGVLSRIDFRGLGGGLRIQTQLPLDEVKIGDSIAVNGACLTVTQLFDDAFEVDFSRETAARTAFSSARVGESVHLERAMLVSARLDGHLVMGHVDSVGTVKKSQSQGDSWYMEVSCDADLHRYVVHKGSVTVHGVSLTVNDLLDDGFSLTIVPLTQKKTFLTQLRPGQLVNLEGDILAKYIERLMGKGPKSGGVSMEKLMRSGFI